MPSLATELKGRLRVTKLTYQALALRRSESNMLNTKLPSGKSHSPKDGYVEIRVVKTRPHLLHLNPVCS